jgi:hypothetical protein
MSRARRTVAQTAAPLTGLLLLSPFPALEPRAVWGGTALHCQGAQDLASLLEAIELSQSMGWTCDVESCPGTRTQTHCLCISCARVLCEGCGGPISSWRPLPAFICQHCQLSDMSSLCLSASGFNPAQATELRALIRGKMHLLGTSKRASTARSYKSGRTALTAFADAFSLPPLPLAPATLMLWCTHGIATRKLDSSTVKLRVLAVGDVYDYCRTHLSMRHLRSPLRDPQVVEVLRTIGVNFKKPGGGSIAITAAELLGLFAHGLTSTTRRGRWARSYCSFLNFGMLRNTAVRCLIVAYEIVDSRVIFLPESHVRLYHHPQFDALCVECEVDSDKNMNAQKASREGGRRAYFPACMPKLGVNPGLDLIEYILRERPPSGGPLFAYPLKRGTGFSTKPCTTFNSVLRDAYRRAFPQATAEYLKMLGTHSGRKTLAQLLWDRGFSRRLIADAGGWFLKKEAMALYFKTAPHVILAALASLSLATTTPPAFVGQAD